MTNPFVGRTFLQLEVLLRSITNTTQPLTSDEKRVLLESARLLKSLACADDRDRAWAIIKARS